MLKPYTPQDESRSTGKTLSKKTMGLIGGAILIVLAAVAGILMLLRPTATLATQRICRPTDKVHAEVLSIQFQTAPDGTIETVSYREGVNPDILMQWMEEDGYTQDQREDYWNQLMDYYMTRFDTLTNGNEHLGWFEDRLDVNKDLYTLQFVADFDFTDETFHAENAKTQTFLSSFDLDTFYDAATQTYRYSETGAQAFMDRTYTPFECVPLE